LRRKNRGTATKSIKRKGSLRQKNGQMRPPADGGGKRKEDSKPD